MTGMYKFGEYGKTIIFFPGGGVDVKCYAPLLQELAKEYVVYAINFSEIQSTSFHNTLEEVWRLLHALNEKELILIGHSFGASVAHALTLGMEEVTQAILINPKVIKITDSRVMIALKLVWKTITGPIKYPVSALFHVKTVNYLLSGLIAGKKMLRQHIKQSLDNILDPEFLVTKNEKNTIIFSTEDIFFPLAKISPDVRKTAILVEGNHDWLMNDVDTSVAMLKHLLSK